MAATNDLDNTVAVIGTLVPTLEFLVLGTQLLRPKGLVPEEQKVAETLGNMLGGIWGPAGFWFMVACLFLGFTGTLKISGPIEAAHIPFVTGMVLYLNRWSLPKGTAAVLADRDRDNRGGTVLCGICKSFT